MTVRKRQIVASSFFSGSQILLSKKEKETNSISLLFHSLLLLLQLLKLKLLLIIEPHTHSHTHKLPIDTTKFLNQREVTQIEIIYYLKLNQLFVTREELNMMIKLIECDLIYILLLMKTK